MRFAVVVLLAASAPGADLTFVEITEIPALQAKQQQTVSVLGARVAIDSNDITFILDPGPKTVTEVDRARAEFSVLEDAGFQARLTEARAALQEALADDLAKQAKWSGVEIAFADPAPGPLLLSVETRLFRWSFKGSLGIGPGGQSNVTIATECALGKPDGWQQVRRLQSADVSPDVFPFMQAEFQTATKQAQQRLDAMEGALLRCITGARMERPETPPLEFESRNEVVSIEPRGDPALFRIPLSYRAVEFPMTPERMIAYLALPSAGPR